MDVIISALFVLIVLCAIFRLWLALPSQSRILQVSLGQLIAFQAFCMPPAILAGVGAIEFGVVLMLALFMLLTLVGFLRTKNIPVLWSLIRSNVILMPPAIFYGRDKGEMGISLFLALCIGFSLIWILLKQKQPLETPNGFDHLLSSIIVSFFIWLPIIILISAFTGYDFF